MCVQKRKFKLSTSAEIYMEWNAHFGVVYMGNKQPEKPGKPAYQRFMSLNSCFVLYMTVWAVQLSENLCHQHGSPSNRAENCPRKCQITTRPG